MMSVRTDRVAGIVLLAAICLQVALGALFRHLQPEAGVSTAMLTGLLHGHSFVVSTFVAVLALFCILRALGFYGGHPPIKRTGLGLLYVVILQLLLGIANFVVVPKGPRDPDAVIPKLEVVLTTLHQANGALLLALAAVLVAWQRRLLTVGPSEAAEPS
jgi:heme A synthase